MTRHPVLAGMAFKTAAVASPGVGGQRLAEVAGDKPLGQFVQRRCQYLGGAAAFDDFPFVHHQHRR